MMIIKRLVLLSLVLVVVGMACSSDEKPTPNVPETLPIITTPTITLDQRLYLESQFSTLQVAQRRIEGIWQDLQAGRQVLCAAWEEARIPPASVQGDDEISIALFQAASDIETAILIWEAECDNPRLQPPPEIIDRGLRAALAADIALQQAGVLLSD